MWELTGISEIQIAGRFELRDRSFRGSACAGRSKCFIWHFFRRISLLTPCNELQVYKRQDTRLYFGLRLVVLHTCRLRKVT